jgi:hypothetical protein
MAAGSKKPIDMAGIARLLEVASTTPQQWRQRGVLPPPDPDLSFPDKPIWTTDVIVAWAKETGRWPHGGQARTRRSTSA